MQSCRPHRFAPSNQRTTRQQRRVDGIRCCVVAVLLSSLSLPQALAAQWRADAHVDAGRVAQPDFGSHGAATMGASLEWLRASVALAGAGAVTFPAYGQPRTQAAFTAVVRSDPRRTLSVEASGLASRYADATFPAMTSGFGGLRMRVRSGPLVFWGGAAAGSLSDGAFAYPHTILETGVAGVLRNVRLDASLARNATLGEPRTEFRGDPPLPVTVRDPLRYMDAVLTMQARPAQFELDGELGVRTVQRTIVLDPLPPARAFGSIAAAWWTTPRVAIAGAAGYDLADLARGHPEALYATIGLRVRLHDSSPTARRRAVRRDAVAGAAPEVLIERGDPSGVALRVLASVSARTIEVAGTFTDWQPVTLDPRGGGAWSLATPLYAGQHRIMVRVDGGEWMPPANLPAVDDDLGGRVGLFTIPEPDTRPNSGPDAGPDAAVEP